jgi:hypothetical protein
VAKSSSEILDAEYVNKARECFKKFDNYYYWRVINVVNEVNVKQLTSEINEFKAMMRRDFYQYEIGEDLFMYENN